MPLSADWYSPACKATKTTHDLPVANTESKHGLHHVHREAVEYGQGTTLSGDVIDFWSRDYRNPKLGIFVEGKKKIIPHTQLNNCVLSTAMVLHEYFLSSRISDFD